LLYYGPAIGAKKKIGGKIFHFQLETLFDQLRSTVSTNV